MSCNSNVFLVDVDSFSQWITSATVLTTPGVQTTDSTRSPVSQSGSFLSCLSRSAPSERSQSRSPLQTSSDYLPMADHISSQSVP